MHEREIDEQLGRSSEVMTINDFIEELAVITELYGEEKIKGEIRVVKEICVQDIDKAATIATLYQQENEV